MEPLSASEGNARGSAHSPGHRRVPGISRSVLARPGLLLLPLAALLVAVGVTFPEREDDEAAYLELASNLTQGHYASGREDALLDPDPASPDLWYGPGLPLVLAPLAAADVPVSLIRFTGPLFLILAIVVFYRLLLRYVRPRMALVGAWALGLYLPFWTLLPNLHSEPLGLLFLVVAMYAIARVVDGGGRRWLAVGAASLAGLAVTRVAFGWVITIALVAFIAWWVVGRSEVPRRLAGMVALALVACVPWLVYTYAETGRFFQWGNSGSLSLYWMASPYAGDHGDWQQASAVFSDENLANHRPLFESIRGLPLSEQNRELERAAVENIAAHPLEYLENVAANISRMWFDAPYSYEPQRVTSLWFALPNAVLLGALVLVAAAVVRVRRSLPAVVVPYAIIGAATFGLHALVAAYPRMFMPVVPAIVFLVLVVIANHIRLVDRKDEAPIREVGDYS